MLHYSCIQHHCTSCWILGPKRSRLILRLFRIALPPYFCRRYPLRMFGIMSSRYRTTALHRGWMQVDCGSWIRWVFSWIRSRADKLGRGRDRDTVRRTAMRYDDHGDGKDVGLRLPLLAADMMAARVPPPPTNILRMSRKRGAGRKYSHSASCQEAELDCVLSTY